MHMVRGFDPRQVRPCGVDPWQARPYEVNMGAGAFAL